MRPEHPFNKVYILCVSVKESDERIPGSFMVDCHGCGTRVYLSNSTVDQVIKDCGSMDGVTIICHPCSRQLAINKDIN